MDAKKISFGFSKIAKKVNLQAGPASVVSKTKDSEKIELISCLEDQSIKIVGNENGNSEPLPMIIPLRDQDKTTIPGRLAKLQEFKDTKVVEDFNVTLTQDSALQGKETLEQQAAREILEDLQGSKETTSNKNSMVVPLKPEDLPLDGGKESTMEDYESVPIEKFGLAMLRGMGWKEDPNKKKDEKLPEAPVVRPKGMGLGAERVPKDSGRQLIPPAKDEVLEMKKGAQVKVLAGKHKDTYGTVESLDEDNGRVQIRFALGGNQESLNEYLLQLVSKAEYSKYSKVLNSAKYEEYKKRTPGGEVSVKEEPQEERKIKREPSDSPPPKPQPPRPEQSNQRERVRYRDNVESSSFREDHRQRDERSHCRSNNDDRRHRAGELSERRERHSPERQSRAESSEEESEESSDRNRSRHRHKSATYARTSSGTKKKSHKYKHRRDHSRDRGNSSDEDERHHKNHKKKTKKSKKQRSRSRSRR